MLDKSNFEVVFSPPDSQKIYFFKEGTGNEKFHFQQFNDSNECLVFNGSILDINSKQAKELILNWNLSDKKESDSSNIEAFKPMVLKAVDEIENSELEKIVVACTDFIVSEIAPNHLFELLCENFKTAFVYALNFNGLCMIGASPEVLMKKQGSILYTEALGGTKAQSGGFTEKEHIEHQQIRIAIESEFKVLNYNFENKDTEVKKAGDLEHLATFYQMNSKGNETDIQLRNHLHPTPAVCGLPRDLAKKFIENNEQFDRLFYAGFLGPEYSNGDFLNMVNLRCCLVYKGVYCLIAGAGINSLSVAEDEFVEVKRKMQTIAQWLK